MRKTCTSVVAGAAGVLLLSALTAAQSDAPRSPWKYYPADARANVGPGGPAPVRDLIGTWAGESSGAGVPRLVRPERPPPLTPLGKQLFDQNLAEGAGVLVAESNDPHVPVLRSVWFSSEHERSDSFDDDRDGAGPDLSHAQVHEYLA